MNMTKERFNKQAYTGEDEGAFECGQLWYDERSNKHVTARGEILDMTKIANIRVLRVLLIRVGVGGRWQSQTYTILEHHTDIYAFIVGMRIPNIDDETGPKNKWNGFAKEHWQLLHRRLWAYALEPVELPADFESIVPEG
jgi:hypothetical protein